MGLYVLLYGIVALIQLFTAKEDRQPEVLLALVLLFALQELVKIREILEKRK